MNHYIAVDVGGTAIKHALLDEEGNLIKQGDLPTPYESLEVFLDTLQAIYALYEKDDPKAFVMSAPGRIDSSKGYFFTGGSLTYISEFNIQEALKERIPLPFSLENDGKAAALAELWKGSMKDVEHGAVLTLGTGVGGALIIHHQLYRGRHFSAGEFSFVSADFEAGYDISGGLSQAKLWATVGSVKSLCMKYAMMKNEDPETMNGRILFERANAHEVEAKACIEQYCRDLAIAIYSLQAIIDVERIAIGGGISKQEILFTCLKEQMQKQFVSIAPFSAVILPEIVACEFSSEANLVGALYHYLYEIGG